MAAPPDDEVAYSSQSPPHDGAGPQRKAVTLVGICAGVGIRAAARGVSAAGTPIRSVSHRQSSPGAQQLQKERAESCACVCSSSLVLRPIPFAAPASDSPFESRALGGLTVGSLVTLIVPLPTT